MKITKFVHSCLLVEMPGPVNRTALFDPGVFSEEALDIGRLVFLDDIIITHIHPDHFSLGLVKRLVAKFPKVRITATPEVVSRLQAEGIAASSRESEGIVFFEAPHEKIMSSQPQNIGVHYLDLLTNPGDSHSFTETKPVLALPVTAPWGSNVAAMELALKLKPKYIIPVHDCHWSKAGREWSYAMMQQAFGPARIDFIQPQTGESFVLDIQEY